MNFLASAIKNYSSNDVKSKVIFHRNSYYKKYNNYEWDLYLGIYFRDKKDLTFLEKKLIDLVYGEILDVGCSTGYYIPYLMEKGTTTGIDISDIIIKFAQGRGYFNCVVGDIFSYKSNHKFNTITLVGNDIALSGTLHGLKKMLKKFKALLEDNGQVLMIMRQVHTLRYRHVVYTPEYDGRFGIPIKCLFLNVNYFTKFCEKQGFTATIIDKEGKVGNSFYLIKLKKC
ncbi:hypothetical protein LCGC14_0744560 [marine sediment metagenome]|uniref:Methyltransferase domain-containing protein n=1 Tax=marine sediment metagenome TaxID=412755 RepID=A0A0F9Q9Y4_9ZZZZ